MLTQYTIEGFENIQYQGFYALQQIENKLSELYYLHGYQEIATPTFESYDFFTAEEGIPGDDLFKLINHQGKVLALKPDATLQIARMAAINHHDPEAVIKFCYRSKLYRHFAAPETVKKELSQMGIEYFGNHSPECDGEVIALAIQSLLVNNITDIHIDMGHVGFINRLFDSIDITEDERATLLRLIETKNLGDIRDFLEQKDYDKDIKAVILKLPRLYGKPQDVFETMESLCVNDGMTAVLQELREIYRHLETIGLEKYITFDIGFTSQMSYYTDLIFKAYINGWGEPVIGGGRYDHLSARFGIDRPACGFGIDLLQLVDYLDQQNLLPKDTNTIYVILYTPERKKDAYETAAKLRKSGTPIELFFIHDTPDAEKNRIMRNPKYEQAKFVTFMPIPDGLSAKNADHKADLKGNSFEALWEKIEQEEGVL